MKPTTTIAVLYLVVAGASAMNPSSYQQFENPDSTEPSQSTGENETQEILYIYDASVGHNNAQGEICLRARYIKCGKAKFLQNIAAFNYGRLYIHWSKCAEFEEAAYYYKISLYNLKVLGREMGAFFQKEFNQKPDDTIPDSMPERPLLEEQNCEELYIEMIVLAEEDKSLDLPKAP
ncbi:hypothetical protein BASA81_013294 [Batrachochytrium salamandrivorans]|nr:hypothetical protein BASA81_013294 [Batrachochytrium salamandrivorans]